MSQQKKQYNKKTDAEADMHLLNESINQIRSGKVSLRQVQANLQGSTIGSFSKSSIQRFAQPETNLFIQKRGSNYVITTNLQHIQTAFTAGEEKQLLEKIEEQITKYNFLSLLQLQKFAKDHADTILKFANLCDRKIARVHF